MEDIYFVEPLVQGPVRDKYWNNLNIGIFHDKYVHSKKYLLDFRATNMIKH